MTDSERDQKLEQLLRMLPQPRRQRRTVDEYLKERFKSAIAKADPNYGETILWALFAWGFVEGILTLTTNIGGLIKMVVVSIVQNGL